MFRFVRFDEFEDDRENPGKSGRGHSIYRDIFGLFREKYPGKKGGKHPFRKP
jgi:hypothetical protein